MKVGQRTFRMLRKNPCESHFARSSSIFLGYGLDLVREFHILREIFFRKPRKDKAQVIFVEITPTTEPELTR